MRLASRRAVAARVEAGALACFNALAHNRDDHAKNFSFLLNERHEWVFAPAYDLTFSYGSGGDQSTMVMHAYPLHSGHCNLLYLKQPTRLGLIDQLAH